LPALRFFLFNQCQIFHQVKRHNCLLISVVVVNCGVLFENKRWVRSGMDQDYPSTRATLIGLAVFYHWPLSYTIGAVVYLVISVVWFYSLFRNGTSGHEFTKQPIVMIPRVFALLWLSMLNTIKA